MLNLGFVARVLRERRALWSHEGWSRAEIDSYQATALFELPVISAAIGWSYGHVAMTLAMQMPSKRPLVPNKFDAKPVNRILYVLPSR